MLCLQIMFLIYLATRFVYYIFTVHIFKPYSRLTNFFIKKFSMMCQICSWCAKKALAKFLVPFIEPITKNLQLKIVLNSLRKYVSKILNTLWPVLTLSPFSPIHHWRKLLKYVVTHFKKVKIWETFNSCT